MIKVRCACFVGNCTMANACGSRASRFKKNARDSRQAGKARQTHDWQQSFHQPHFTYSQTLAVINRYNHLCIKFNYCVNKMCVQKLLPDLWITIKISNQFFPRLNHYTFSASNICFYFYFYFFNQNKEKTSKRTNRFSNISSTVFCSPS